MTLFHIKRVGYRRARTRYYIMEDVYRDGVQPYAVGVILKQNDGYTITDIRDENERYLHKGKRGLTNYPVRRLALDTLQEAKECALHYFDTNPKKPKMIERFTNCPRCGAKRTYEGCCECLYLVD